MFEELDRLRESVNLSGLLLHYGRLSETDRAAWHPRQNDCEGLDPRDLTKLHGELIACGWVEIAIARSTEAGRKSGGYRITVEGRRALREIGVVLATPAPSQENSHEGAEPEKRRRKRTSTLPVEAPTAVQSPVDSASAA